MSGWEIVHDEPLERVRRIVVPGGWIYQVETDRSIESQEHGVANVREVGWGPPVFVPVPGASS